MNFEGKIISKWQLEVVSRQLLANCQIFNIERSILYLQIYRMMTNNPA